MGFLGLLRFSLMCLDFLAWPAFALGYPIWASIRAIETGSKYHMEKLVTYWTVFSLISLLEHAFRLNQWVPYWPYIKLIAICWLVIPCFNGACHVYQNIIHPCSSVSLQTVINWFCCPEEKESVKDMFLTSLETYLKENGSEALEKLIASKRNCKEHHVADAEFLMEKVELTEKTVVAEEPRLLQLNVTDTGEAKEREGMIEKNAAAEGQRLLQLNIADTGEDMEREETIKKNATAEGQKLLQLNVADIEEDKEREEMIDKNAAAEGQRLLQLNVVDIGEDKEQEEMIDKNVVAEGQRLLQLNVAETGVDKEREQNREKNVAAEGQRLLQLNIADTGEDKERKEMMEENATAEQQRLYPKIVSSGNQWMVKHPRTTLAKTEPTAAEVPTMSMPAFTEGKKTWEVAAAKKTQLDWTCAVCQVTTTSEAILNSHLKGKKHKSKSEKLKNGKQIAKEVLSPPTDHANKKPKNCQIWREKQIPTAKLENAHNTPISGNKQMQKKPNSAYNLRCDSCNVWCSGEVDMAAHLNGSTHLYHIQSRANFVTANMPEIVNMNGKKTQ